MSSQRYAPEFKDEAVRQILERGYSVAELSQSLTSNRRQTTAVSVSTIRAGFI